MGFMQTMREEFKFMVTPLVFDFVLSLMAEGSATCIAEAFGSGDDERAIGDNGEVMNVNSIFASQHDADDRVKGGAVQLRLKTKVNGRKGKGDNAMSKDVFYEIAVRATYNDIDGKGYELTNAVMFGGGEQNVKLVENEQYFDNSGIRKAVVLVRYVQLLRLWMAHQQKQADKTMVSDEYKAIIASF